jgi:hypothetical protein
MQRRTSSKQLIDIRENIPGFLNKTYEILNVIL